MRRVGTTNQKFICDKIYGYLNELKYSYKEEYGEPCTWTSDQKIIFMMNGDLVITDVLEKHKLSPHKYAKKEGLTYGIYKLQVMITEDFLDKYKKQKIEDLNEQQEIILTNELLDAFFCFLIEGLS